MSEHYAAIAALSIVDAGMRAQGEGYDAACIDTMSGSGVVALRSIEQDGAAEICLGSSTMHLAADWLATRLPVPLINPGPLTYKLAESALALKLTHSRCAHPKPLVPKLAMVRAMPDAAVAHEKKCEQLPPMAREGHFSHCLVSRGC